jgi:hypothetical protein
MPQSIPPGLAVEHVLKALAELDAGVAHPFGSPTGYELVHDGKRHPPKAVVGLAFRHAMGRLLRPDEFSGGEAPGQANYVLRQLGFTVVEKAKPEEEKTRTPWSESEVRLVVADYFSMLEKELLGKPLNKSEHRRLLSPQLAGRPDGSIERKHQNISAVLAKQGFPYIDGYKPLSHVQASLSSAVESFLDGHPGFLEQLATAPTLNPDKPVTDIDLETAIEDPPEEIADPNEQAKPWLSMKGKRIDFAERDAANRRLSKLGEQFVVDLEKLRLKVVGRDDLASKVEWVANSRGDGLGFDVLSFEEDESERWVEVKTTGQGKFARFYVTATEVRCSEDRPNQYYLYRVFDYSRSPRAYILPGSLRETCRLFPIQYLAAI